MSEPGQQICIAPNCNRIAYPFQNVCTRHGGRPMKKGDGNRPPDGIERKLIYVDLGEHTRKVLNGFNGTLALFWALGVAWLVWAVAHFGC